MTDPFWLDEAYADPKTSDALDSGAVWRNATAARFIEVLAPELPSGPWVDYGSGRGLLKQELSKRNFTIQEFDPYRGHTTLPTEPCALIACFEVLEHQTQPVEFLERLATMLHDSGVIALSTWLRNPTVHGEHWGYLAVEGGQHVTFLSPLGLARACNRVGLRWWCTAVSQEHSDFQIHVLAKRQKLDFTVEGFSMR